MVPTRREVMTIAAAAGLSGLGGAAKAAPLELRVGVASHTATLDFQAETSNATAQMLDCLVDTLIEVDTTSATPRYLPALATAWTRISPTVTEFRLREGVRLHDGNIMDAADVAFSLNRVFRPTEPRYRASYGRYFYNFDRVEIVDPLTVRIVTLRPDPLLEALLSCRNAGIASRRQAEAIGLDRAAQMPAGTGPYKLARFTPNAELVVERFDGFWGKPAPLERVRFIRVPEMATRIAALLNQDIDFAVSIPPDQQKLLRGHKSIRLVPTTWPMFFIYVLNMSHKVTADARLRRALNLAIDRKALSRGLWEGQAIPAHAHYFEGFGGHDALHDIDLLPFDPAAARRLLAEAGYRGEEIRLSFQSNYYTYGNLAAQAVAEMWQDVGVKVKLEQLEAFTPDVSQYMTRDWSNPMYFSDMMGAFDPHWSAKSWVTTERWFRPDLFPDYAALYDAVRYGADPAQRLADYRRLITYAETVMAPWILLYQPSEAFAMRADIAWEIPRNVRPYQLPFRAGQIRIG